MRLFRWLMRKHLAKEIGFDMDILNGLANYETSLEGMKLSRFDRVLGLNRERIERIYRSGGIIGHANAGLKPFHRSPTSFPHDRDVGRCESAAGRVEAEYSRLAEEDEQVLAVADRRAGRIAVLAVVAGPVRRLGQLRLHILGPADGPGLAIDADYVPHQVLLVTGIAW